MWRRLARPRRGEPPATPPGWVWPVRLGGSTPSGLALTLRPLEAADAPTFRAVRQANAEWLAPWDATSPDPDAPDRTFAELVEQYERDGAGGRALPLVVEAEGRIVGQVTAGTVVFGSFRSCTVGYWVSRSVAGRLVVPTAVALLCDHLVARVGLHRVEVNIRPENTASLAVVRKLGFRSEGARPHYLHIDGAWQDHLSFALTTEDLRGESFRARLDRVLAENQPSHESLARHTGRGPAADGRGTLPS